MSRPPASPSAPAPAAPSKNEPVATFRMGPIKATVWANLTKDGRIMHNTTITRSYTDATGAWNDINSYGRHDLPLVALLAQKATSWIYAERAKLSAADKAARFADADESDPTSFDPKSL